MGAMGYLYWKIVTNHAKTALHKPITYFYLVILVIYFTVVPMSLRMTVELFHGDSAEGLVMVLTVLAFWMIPANLIAYSRRKGLVYRKADVHFLFPAPVRPKLVLLYAYLKTLTVQVILNLFALVYGRVLFHVQMWRLGLYFIFSIFVQNVLEAGIMLLLYGDRRLGERRRALVVKAAYGLAGLLVLLGILAYFQGGMKRETVAGYLLSDRVRMVPVIGWYISVLHLLFLEPVMVDAVGTVCYFLFMAAVLVAAWKLDCTGDFYEDAMKFADDYEEVLESRRQGNIRRKPGRRQKFGRASVHWKGHGAKALFYRQLLEYRKSRYFIFDGSTLAAALGGAGIAYLYIHEGGFGDLETYSAFVLPVVSSYFIFLFTALNGKWAKELLSPYTYLIPDTVFRKLLNATAIQNVQSLVNACLFILPGAIAMGLPFRITALAVLYHVVLSANKLYAYAVAEAVCGSTLGRVGKQMLQLLIQGLAIVMAALGAVLGMALGDILQAYVLMDVFLVLFTVIFMVIAMLNFYNMEKA